MAIRKAGLFISIGATLGTLGGTKTTEAKAAAHHRGTQTLHHRTIHHANRGDQFIKSNSRTQIVRLQDRAMSDINKIAGDRTGIPKYDNARNLALIDLLRQDKVAKPAAFKVLMNGPEANRQAYARHLKSLIPQLDKEAERKVVTMPTPSAEAVPLPSSESNQPTTPPTPTGNFIQDLQALAKQYPDLEQKISAWSQDPKNTDKFLDVMADPHVQALPEVQHSSGNLGMEIMALAGKYPDLRQKVVAFNQSQNQDTAFAVIADSHVQALPEMQQSNKEAAEKGPFSEKARGSQYAGDLGQLLSDIIILAGENLDLRQKMLAWGQDPQNQDKWDAMYNDPRVQALPEIKNAGDSAQVVTPEAPAQPISPKSTPAQDLKFPTGVYAMDLQILAERYPDFRRKMVDFIQDPTNLDKQLVIELDPRVQALPEVQQANKETLEKLRIMEQKNQEMMNNIYRGFNGYQDQMNNFLQNLFGR